MSYPLSNKLQLPIGKNQIEIGNVFFNSFIICNNKSKQLPFHHVEHDYGIIPSDSIPANERVFTILGVEKSNETDFGFEISECGKRFAKIVRLSP